MITLANVTAVFYILSKAIYLHLFGTFQISPVHRIQSTFVLDVLAEMKEL